MTMKTHSRTAWRAMSCAVALSAACWGLGSSAGAAPSEPAGDGYYELRVAHSDMCLDVAGKALHHGAKVVQATCTPGSTNQAWNIKPLGGDRFLIRAMHSGLCLDVAHASSAHAARVVQADCHGGDNQAWGFFGGPQYERRADGQEMPRVYANYKLVAKHSGHCLDVAHYSVRHGTDVVQAHCSAPGYNQLWRLVPR
ncbi:RICIN domain-containing protein [Streptomyces sp. NBC_00654]|uniref:RICIN domain-containing protein n=1 Tax=Streptomyces sp. NBC_00654 TaxID=2975799 RepID=UPI0022503412|nr:RICIN domain-containing protein [Streptomyces sp. NBC_00654]MCX4964126.1 RICIN domain-containing protein [Streptomyces sp. NBC_00654]